MQYRMEFAEEKQKKLLEPQNDMDDTDQSWSSIWRKIDTVGAKTVDSSQKLEKEVNSVFAEFSELHMTFETATAKQFGLINHKKSEKLKEEAIKEELINNIEESKDVDMKQEDEDDLLPADQEEYRSLKKILKPSVKNLFRFTKNQGEISRDLDRFILKRVEKSHTDIHLPSMTAKEEF